MSKLSTLITAIALSGLSIFPVWSKAYATDLNTQNPIASSSSTTLKPDQQADHTSQEEQVADAVVCNYYVDVYGNIYQVCNYYSTY